MTRFTQAVTTVWDEIFHPELQSQRMPDEAPPIRTDREWCRMYIASYKAKLLRGVTSNLQHGFRVFLRCLETVFLVDNEDTSRALLHSAPPPPPPSSPTTVADDDDNDPAPHPFLVLRDRFSAAPNLEDTSANVTSFVSAHLDGRTQVCSLQTQPLPFHLVMNCYRTTDGRDAYARLNVHVDDRSDVHDALNTFLLSVADDVLERGGTHREL